MKPPPLKRLKGNGIYLFIDYHAKHVHYVRSGGAGDEKISYGFEKIIGIVSRKVIERIEAFAPGVQAGVAIGKGAGGIGRPI